MLITIILIVLVIVYLTKIPLIVILILIILILILIGIYSLHVFLLLKYLKLFMKSLKCPVSLKKMIFSKNLDMHLITIYGTSGLLLLLL